MKKAIIVGASSGIGACLAERLAKEGWKVAAIARRMDRLQALNGDLLLFRHDVTNYQEVPELFQEITKQLGGLDLIVYSAGLMPEVGAHEYSFEKDQKIVEVNVIGAMAWLDQAAIRFENTKHGSIVALGSVAGDRGRSGQPAYNASKAALATYMEALRNRLARLGVHVVTIKPGPVQTEMTSHLHLKNAMPVEVATTKILERIERTGEHYLNPVHAVVFWIIRNIPSPIFRRMSL